MTVTYELPAIKREPDWNDRERTEVNVDGFTYTADNWIDAYILDTAEELARALAAKRFAAEQAELARLDCAGEVAYNAYYGSYDELRGPGVQWESFGPKQRSHWIAAAKAVLDDAG